MYHLKTPPDFEVSETDEWTDRDDNSEQSNRNQDEQSEMEVCEIDESVDHQESSGSSSNKEYGHVDNQDSETSQDMDDFLDEPEQIEQGNSTHDETLHSETEITTANRENTLSIDNPRYDSVDYSAPMRLEESDVESGECSDQNISDISTDEVYFPVYVNRT